VGLIVIRIDSVYITIDPGISTNGLPAQRDYGNRQNRTSCSAWGMTAQKKSGYIRARAKTLK
jgi:hypothetical protein